MGEKTRFHNKITKALNTYKRIQVNEYALRAWEDVRQFVEICIATQPIRIHDEKKEGLFYHTKRPAATIDNSKISQEEGLSYALFNSREILNLDTKIIGYEAYLLRQPQKFSNAIGVKCDLVAYDPKKFELTAIEVKKKALEESTKIEFGMLQAKAYGYMLTRLHAMKYNLLKQHIAYCLESNYSNYKNFDGKIQKISFALAAPKSYFTDSLRNNSQLQSFLEPLEKTYFTLGFGGYWVIDDDCVKNIKGTGNGKKCIPEFDKCGNNQIQIYKSFVKLKNGL